MESYEKKYKEALSWMQSLYNGLHGATKKEAEHYFPELKENEDERIRKWLEEHIEAMPDNSIEFKDVKRIDVLHWLEEQGEQKLNGTFVNVDDVREDFIDEVYRVLDADPTNDRANQIIDAFDNLPTVTIKQDPCEHCKMTYSTCYSFPCDEKKAFEQGKTALEAIKEERVDNVNKVAPKFKVKYAGNEYNVFETKDIAGVTYYGIEDEPNHIDYVLPDNCEIVSEQKLADKVEPKFNIGDVICDKLCTTLNKEAQPNMEIVDIQNGMYICDKGSFPVSQQDEYVLVSKKIDSKLNDESVSNELREASTKHAEKELKNQTFPGNLEFELIYTFEEGAKWQAAQKHTEWSEEDNVMIRCITLDLELLKNRDDGKAGKAAYQSEIEWLKSLKDRVGCEANCTTTKEWKPSDEQMKAFENFVRGICESGYASPYENNTKLLYSLQEQLKKLK